MTEKQTLGDTVSVPFFKKYKSFFIFSLIFVGVVTIFGSGSYLYINSLLDPEQEEAEKIAKIEVAKAANEVTNPNSEKSNQDNKLNLENLKSQYITSQEKQEVINNQQQPTLRPALNDSSFDELFGEGKQQPKSSISELTGVPNNQQISSKIRSGTISIKNRNNQSTNSVTGADQTNEWNTYNDPTAEILAAINAGQEEGGETGNTAINNLAIRNERFSPQLSFVKLNPDYFVPQESYISCVLERRIVSNFDGTAVCSVIDDVYSANGENVLIPRGTKLYGKYSSAGLAAGDSKLFIIWETARTPKLLEITLSSEATNQLGVIGADGIRDNKFFQRFASSLLVSGIADTGKYAGYRLNGNKTKKTTTLPNGTTIEEEAPDFTENTRNALVDIAQNLVLESINVKPTITINQGTVLGVLLSKDLDFSTVWKKNNGIK